MARSGGLRPPLAFFLIALLALPLVAHGCHGDDVDHEPLFVPLKLTEDDR